MKRNIFFYVLIFTCYLGTSQSISSVEYFFNTDPGVGNGTALAVNSNTGALTQTFTISTSTLSEGFNNLYLRTQNSNGNWALYDRELFYLKSFNTLTISAAEYFFDTDPGVGNANALSVDSNTGELTQAYTITTGSLSVGFHSFYLRTQDSDGNWSLYDRQIIYIKDFDFSSDEVISAEYFIDSDPGIGNGTSIVFGNASQSTQSLNVDTTGLGDGEHLFYVRVQDTSGDWSIYDTALFTIDSSLNVEDNLLSNISLLPNPFENKLSLKLPSNIQIIKTEIYNTLGQTVYFSLENKSSLDLTNLESGLYILSLKTNQGSASFKIVKK